jgi:hypothetical protein
MYFHKLNGKQAVDFRGDLILSHNDQLIKTRSKSSAPRAAKNAKYILDISNLGLFKKLRATGAAISFIWGPSQALTAETINREGL